MLDENSGVVYHWSVILSPVFPEVPTQYQDTPPTGQLPPPPPPPPGQHTILESAAAIAGITTATRVMRKVTPMTRGASRRVRRRTCTSPRSPGLTTLFSLMFLPAVTVPPPRSQN